MKIVFKEIGLFLIFLFVFALCSCVSTREYMKTQRTLYEDDVAVEEIFELKRDRKVLESRSKKFYDLADVCSKIEEDKTMLVMNSFTAVKEKSSKSANEDVTFSLMEYRADKATNEIQTYVLGTKIVKVQNGKVSDTSDSDGNQIKARGDTFNDDMEKFFNENLEKMVSFMFTENESNEEEESIKITKDKKRQEVANSEKVLVESTPNENYIFYSIVGKPFVIAGVTTWNVLKCAGYALFNFVGGYNLVTGSSSGRIWMLPSYKKSKEKAVAAKEANKIQHYPEYHLPFTDNHIIVDKYDRDISVLTLANEGAEEIVPIEHNEFGTTMSVSRSAAADAASTAAVAGLIGTVVTIPVSVVTWIGGAAMGIWAGTQKK